jgi:hypothetical protein
MSSWLPNQAGFNALAGVLAKPQILLVTYDLRTPMHNYNPFYEALQQQGDWWHYLTFTWLIFTNKTAQTLYNSIIPHVTTKDSVFIVPVTKPYWGYLPKDAWDWINARITN